MVAKVKGEIEILDPTPDEYDVEALELALRSEGLNNKVLGLLGNGKPNALPLLEAIAEVISTRYEFAGIVKRNRKTFGKVDFYPGERKPREVDGLIMEFVEKCDLVLSGVGD